MSDGKTEAYKGMKIDTESKSVYIGAEDLKHMPNQKRHRNISFLKSTVRIVGYCLIPFNLVAATFLLIFSEVIGIIEELV